jgi:hypothetical protein
MEECPNHILKSTLGFIQLNPMNARVITVLGKEETQWSD